MEKVLVPSVLLHELQALDVDLGKQSDLIPGIIQLKVVVRKLDRNLIEITWRLKGLQNIFLLPSLKSNLLLGRIIAFAIANLQPGSRHFELDLMIAPVRPRG